MTQLNTGFAVWPSAPIPAKSRRISRIPTGEEDMLEIEDIKSEKPDKAKKDTKDVKNSLDFAAIKGYTYVVAVAIHKNPSRNAPQKISTRNGIPIGGYVYNHVEECYLFNCADTFPLGMIPVSFILTMKDAGTWSTTVPVPEVVLRRHFNANQRQELRRWRETLSSDFEVQYLQFTSHK